MKNKSNKQEESRQRSKRKAYNKKHKRKSYKDKQEKKRKRQKVNKEWLDLRDKLAQSVVVRTKIEGSGMIQPSGDIRVRKNRDMTFIMKAAAGYRIQDIWLDGISVFNKADGAGNEQGYVYFLDHIINDHDIQVLFEEDVPEWVTIYFETNGGDAIEPIVLEKGTSLSEEIHAIRSGYAFAGWFLNQELTEVFYLEDPVMDDITLYAAYNAIDDEFNKYETTEIFEEDYPQDYKIKLVSEIPLNNANLGDYVKVEVYVGNLPTFSVSGENGRYVIEAVNGYTPAGYYHVTLSDGVFFEQFPQAVRHLRFMIYQEEMVDIEYAEGIKTVYWEDVIEHVGDYISLPAGDESFNVGDVLFLTDQERTVSLMMYQKVTKVEKDTERIILQLKDCEFEDIYRKINLFQKVPLNLADSIDPEQLQVMAQSMEEGKGLRQLTAIAAHVLNESDILKTMSFDDEPFTPIRSYDIDMGSFKVAVSYGEGDNNNFRIEGDKWIYFRFIATVTLTLKNRMEILFTFDIMQGLSASLHGYSSSTNGDFLDYTMTFNYWVNMYTQTDISLSALIRTANKAYTYNISDMIKSYMNGTSSYDNNKMVDDLRELYGSGVEPITLLDESLYKYTLTLFYVFNITFETRLNIKISLAAGIGCDLRLLTANVIGFYAKLSTDIKDIDMHSYCHELDPLSYDFLFYFQGYMRILLSLTATISLSITGLNWLGSIGVGGEIGPYLDIYGYYYARIKDTWYSRAERESAGGYYIEVGLFIRLYLFGKILKKKAELTIVNIDIPIFSFGDRYIMLKLEQVQAIITMRHDRIAVKDLGIMSAEWLDLKELEVIPNLQRNTDKFYASVSNQNFRVRYEEGGTAYIERVTQYVDTGELKRMEAIIYLYYSGASMHFKDTPVKQIKLIYISPYLNIEEGEPLKQYKIRFFYEGILKHEQIGYAGEAIQSPYVYDPNAFGHGWDKGGEYEITRDRDIHADVWYRKGDVSFNYQDSNNAAVSDYQNNIRYGVLPSVPQLPECPGFKILGWGEEILPVNKAYQYYTARYEYYQYTVRFLYPSVDVVINNKLERTAGYVNILDGLQYGDIPEPFDEITYPGKYQIRGYSPQVQPVKGSTEYTVIYEKELFAIIFLDSQGEIYTSYERFYAERMEYPLAPPEKEDEGEQIYSFAYWMENEVKSEPRYVERDSVFVPYYIMSLKQYIITLDAAEGTFTSGKIKEYAFPKGTDPNPLVESPVKASDDYNHYPFDGWNLSLVTDDITYQATYTPSIRYYDVTLDADIGAFADGQTLRKQTMTYEQILHINEQGIIPPVAPSNERYNFIFKTWHQFSEDKTKFRALYDQVERRYLVTLKANGGKFPDASDVSYMWKLYGDKNILYPTPERVQDDFYTYVFSGWMDAEGNQVQPDQEVEITNDVVYTAEYQNVKRIYTVVVSAGDGVFPDGTQRKEYKGGYEERFDFDFTNIKPVKASDMTYEYSFSGWGEPTSTVILGNHVYTAHYQEAYIEYEIVFDGNGGVFESTGEGTRTISAHYNDKLENIEEPVRKQDQGIEYVFDGWSPYLADVTGNAHYEAIYRYVVHGKTGITIAKGDQAEDISDQTIQGYTYEVRNVSTSGEDDPEKMYIRLTIKDSGFTISGTGKNIVISLEAPSMTINTLKISNGDEIDVLANIMGSASSDMTIYFKGANSFERQSQGEYMYFYESVLLKGIGDNPTCGISCGGLTLIGSYEDDIVIEDMTFDLDIKESTLGTVAAISAGMTFDSEPSNEAKVVVRRSTIKLNGKAWAGIVAPGCVDMDEISEVKLDTSAEVGAAIVKPCKDNGKEKIGITITANGISEDISQQTIPGYRYTIVDEGEGNSSFGRLQIMESNLEIGGSGENVSIVLSADAEFLFINRLQIINNKGHFPILTGEANTEMLIYFDGLCNFESLADGVNDVGMRFTNDVEFRVALSIETECNLICHAPVGIKSFDANIAFVDTTFDIDMKRADGAGPADAAICASGVGKKVTIQGSTIKLSGEANFGIKAGGCVDIDTTSTIEINSDASTQFDTEIQKLCP